MNMLRHCYVAADVRTPEGKLLADVKEYVFPGISDVDIDFMKSASCWMKVVRLAERLEFVYRLDKIRQTIDERTREIVSCQGGVETREFKCDWMGDDFAGAQKDIESLEIFLLVSAIDEMVEDYVQLDQYLMKEWAPPDGLDVKLYLESLIKQHHDRYGMMNGLRKAFRELLDEKVGRLWLDSYCALKLRRKEDESGFGFREEDYDDWMSLSDDAKKTKLMNALAQCRNQYVHSATRQFECDVPVCRRVYEKTKEKELWLLRMYDGCELIPLLWETIQSIAKNLFRKQ